MSSNKWISQSDHGDRGQPGDQYYECWAGVKKAPNGDYELHVHAVWGSNQGYLEEHTRYERRYRAVTLEQVMRVGIAEIRRDEDFQPADKFVAAIRDAIFDAQDAEANVEST